MGRRHVSRVVRTETRRRLRAVADDDRKVVALAISGLVMVPFALVLVGLAYFAGRAIAGGSGVDIVVARTAVTGVVAMAAFVAGLSTLQRNAVPAGADALLLAVPHRAAAVSVLLLEVGYTLVLFGIPAVLAAAVFAVGAGSVSTGVLAVLAALAALTLGAVLGFTVAVVARLAVARSKLLARFKTVASILVMLAYFTLVFGFEEILGRVLMALTSLPVTWLADLALLGLAEGAGPLRAVAGLASVVVAVGAFVAATVDLTGRLWYESPVDPGTDATSGRSVTLPLVGRQVNQVVQKTWVRARRSPIRLIYVAYPVFFAIGPLVTVLQGGSVPPLTVPSLALYGAWATGAAFTLNPFGDESPALPATLTTPVSGRTFVGALWLAGGVIGAPVTLLVTVAAAVLVGYAPGDALLVALAGVALAGFAPGLASGIGAALPRLEPASVTRTRTAVVPSLIAFAVYSIALFVLSLPVYAVTPGSLRQSLVGMTGLSPTVVGIATIAVTVALSAAFAGVSFRSACGRFDEYTLD